MKTPERVFFIEEWLRGAYKSTLILIMNIPKKIQNLGKNQPLNFFGCISLTLRTPSGGKIYSLNSKWLKKCMPYLQNRVLTFE